jgi:hypothetical protein
MNLQRAMNNMGKFLAIAGLLLVVVGAAVVGLWQRLARAFARRHQLHQGRFQFSLSPDDLPDFERAPDAAVVAVQKINKESRNCLCMADLSS